MSCKYRHGQPTIGVLAGWQFAWTATPLSYLDPIFRGASLAALDLGCNVLLGCGMGLWTRQSDVLRPAWPFASSSERILNTVEGSDFVPIGPWNTDGLIVVNPLHSQPRSRYVQDLIAGGYPVIFIAAGEHGPTIAADNRGGILKAMQHLVSHGHQSIAFIAGTPEDMDGDTGDRLRAYHDAVNMHSLLDNSRLVAWGRHLYDGGYTAMQEILATGLPFTAILASNDESALGAMQALREAGYSIPQDVAIVGFDDRPESAVQQPTLSSVRVPLRKMGYLALKSLHRYLTGQTESIESARVATRLVARESCGCGQRVMRAVILGESASQKNFRAGTIDWFDKPEKLVQAMAAVVLSEPQDLLADEVAALCQRLVDAFQASIEQSSRAPFQESLEALLHRVAYSGDNAYIWQGALSVLVNAFNQLSRTWSQPKAHDLAHALLDWARVTISETVQQQYRQHVVGQRWALNRLGTLTARLLAALNETQIYKVLAQHLPAMGVQSTWIALFEAEGDDPLAWTTLRDIMALEQVAAHFRSREFPPAGMLSLEHPFSLALFPLTGPRGQLGYVVFDTAHLDLYSAIAQQLTTALNSAQLYREATEGRRLAEEANELKSRFLSMVSHELRTPLNLIVGLSGILLQESDERDTPLPDMYQKDIEHIYANAQLLGGLIGDVLDLASSDAGQLRLTNEFIDLSEALRLVAETGHQFAYQKGLAWHAELPASGPWVWGDRTRLRQVALNLINNAIKFTAQGEVRLKLESGPDFVTVVVCDTGIGIPLEEQAFIFDEFRRSERSRTRGYGGLGLGLAICKRLVEMHGGAIGLHSSGEEDAGSTFYFTLPTVPPPAMQAQHSELSPLTKESILVLSRRAGAGQRLQEHLNERGFDAQIAFIDETPDWLSRLVMSPPGAVVIDVSTTPHQGWSVLKSIKGHPKTQHLPVLFFSLSPDGGSVLEFDYLTKPIELTDLTRALDQHWLVPDTERGFKTILIVDDDLSTLDMHARIVQAHSPSHRVLKARNGLEALEIFQREHIDLVLLDLMMPKLDGFGVLEGMREIERAKDNLDRESTTSVIVLTGQVLTESDMQRLDRGVATVLSKGIFSLEETLEHVDIALERNRELSDEAQRLVRQAMAYIHEHYAEPISRTDLAQHVALSEDYLTFCFRKELGVPPIAYLNRFRINQAQRLLNETHKSITEIAWDVGFSDSGYFSRVFRREVGVSPTTYRQG